MAGKRYNGSSANNTYTGAKTNDTLNGGDGDDTLNGGAGNDQINGGSDDDSLLGAAGNDSLLGGDGYDYLSGGDGNDTLGGGTDNDTLLGGSGNDDLTGNSGEDSHNGGSGNDTINGGNGDDTILGTAGNDSLLGSGGDDYLRGDAGGDLLNGGLGDDTLFGGAGNDTITDSAGNDVYRFSDGFGSDQITDTNGLDTLDFSDVTTALNIDLTKLVFTTAQTNSISINKAVAAIIGGSGNDTIVDRSWNRSYYQIYSEFYSALRLYGGDGNDSITASEEGSGSQYFYGEAGNDTLSGPMNDASVYLHLMDGGDGDDVLNMGRVYKVFGGSGNDTYNDSIGLAETTLYDESGNDTYNLVVPEDPVYEPVFLIDLTGTDILDFGDLAIEDASIETQEDDSLAGYDQLSINQYRIVDFFDNSSEDLSAIGAGEGCIETLIFNGVSYDFDAIVNYIISLNH